MLAVSQHLIIAQVDVHGEQAVKAGQFVVDLGAKIMHLKPVLELLVIGHQYGAGHDGLGLLLLQEHPFLLLLLGFKFVSRHSKAGHVNMSP